MGNLPPCGGGGLGAPATRRRGPIRAQAAENNSVSPAARLIIRGQRNTIHRIDSALRFALCYVRPEQSHMTDYVEGASRDRTDGDQSGPSGASLDIAAFGQLTMCCSMDAACSRSALEHRTGINVGSVRCLTLAAVLWTCLCLAMLENPPM